VTDLRTTEGLDAAYRDFGAPLFRFAARSLGDRGLAEEAVQETFVRAWRGADRYDETRGPLQAWLFAICRNLVIDMSRARKIRPAMADRRVAGTAETEAGVDAIDKMVQSAALEEALRRVGPEHRQVLIEVVILDRPQEAVAAELGVPVGTVKSRVFYGLRSLRNSLQAIGWNDD
jgi:RNA polymerase sigma-70 factor (ECF subfamily)